MNPILAQLEELKAQWLAAQPLPGAKHDELWRKFRLEWNYNSNHIEGNTLTYGETELLLIMGQTKGDHSIREYDEMKAHDAAVAHIAELAKERAIVRETDIRNFNKIILKEPYWADAVTEHRQTTQVEIIPGEYKRHPNNVKSPTGEPILFASPTDTPARMQEFVAWMHAELDAPKLHPVEFAAQCHHRFLTIHPFADGNGRVARLLANYFVMREGFPPIIVKSRDKAAYIAALRIADVGEPEKLTDYFVREMKWSLDMAHRAMRGESLNEPGDVEKEIAVFINQQAVKDRVALSRTKEVIEQLADQFLARFFKRAQEKMMRLEPLFNSTLLKSHLHIGHISAIDWNEGFSEFIKVHPRTHTFDAVIQFIGYKGQARIPFDVGVTLRLNFDQYRYSILRDGKSMVDRRYDESLSSDEVEALTEDLLGRVFAVIKNTASQQ